MRLLGPAPRLRHDPRRAARATALSATVLLLPSAFSSLAAGAPAPVPGEATIVGPRDAAVPSSPIPGGDAASPFSIDLPDGAACTGDSIEGEYRVQSFMVPVSVDPASLTFEGMGPAQKGVGAAFRQPLYAVNTTAFANAATNLADEPGGPGTIINIPNFSLGVFKPGDVPAGRYSVGIACTKGPASATQLDKLWSTTLDIELDAQGSLTWRAASPGPIGSAGAEAAMSTPPDPSDVTGSVGPTEPPIGADPAGTAAPDAADTAVSGGGQPSFNLPVVVTLRDVGPDGHSDPQLLVLGLIVLVLLRIGYVLSRAFTAVRDLP